MIIFFFKLPKIKRKRFKDLHKDITFWCFMVWFILCIIITIHSENHFKMIIPSLLGGFAISAITGTIFYTKYFESFQWGMFIFSLILILGTIFSYIYLP